MLGLAAKAFPSTILCHVHSRVPGLRGCPAQKREHEPVALAETSGVDGLEVSRQGCFFDCLTAISARGVKLQPLARQRAVTTRAVTHLSVGCAWHVRAMSSVEAPYSIARTHLRHAKLLLAGLRSPPQEGTQRFFCAGGELAKRQQPAHSGMSSPALGPMMCAPRILSVFASASIALCNNGQQATPSGCCRDNMPEINLTKPSASSTARARELAWKANFPTYASHDV